jgi:hypothetical protein
MIRVIFLYCIGTSEMTSLHRRDHFITIKYGDLPNEDDPMGSLSIHRFQHKIFLFVFDKSFQWSVSAKYLGANRADSAPSFVMV